MPARPGRCWCLAAGGSCTGDGDDGRALLFVLLVVSIAGGELGEAGSTAVTRPALGATCDPIQTPPTFAGQTPTAQTVLGFGLGSQEVTAAEADRAAPG